MTDVAQSFPVTEAVIDVLRTIENPGGGDVQVGDAVKPVSPTPPPRSFFPYAVVYSGVTRIQGSLVEPKEDGLHRIQVTSIGLDRGGAEWLRDQVRALLLDVTTLDIDGYTVVWTELVTSLPIARDDDVTPAQFYAVDVINLFTTPAAPGS